MQPQATRATPTFKCGSGMWTLRKQKERWRGRRPYPPSRRELRSVRHPRFSLTWEKNRSYDVNFQKRNRFRGGTKGFCAMGMTGAYAHRAGEAKSRLQLAVSGRIRRVVTYQFHAL